MRRTPRGRAGLPVLLAVLALLVGGCSTATGTAPARPTAAPTSSAASPGPATATTSAPGADWVRTENARPGDTGWRISRFAASGQLDGYVDHPSVRPGDPVRLYVSSALGPVAVAVHRVGWYGGAQGRTVWSDPQKVPAVQQRAPTRGRFGEVRADWTPSLTLDTTGWPEGDYLITLRAGGRGRWVPLVLRSADRPAGRLVVLNALTTWQAYNAWGGASLYKGPDGKIDSRSLAVSFLRPYDGNGAVKFMEYEHPLVSYLESLGLDLAYTTSLDLDESAAAVEGAAGVVSLGHDEYWSRGMRSHLERARDAGTNLAFLGANAVYWRVRFAPGSHDLVMVETKETSLDTGAGSQATGLWRQPPGSDPENSLTGMLYECFPAEGDMVVTDPGFFLFAGTGVAAGTRVPGIVGSEVDRAYPIAGTPADLQVVTDSPVRCPSTGMTHSTSTYYTTASGAGVFSTGTMGWALAVRGPIPHLGITAASTAFARTVTRNLATAMLAGPMARAHPAVGNLAALHLSPDTATGTGRRVVR